MNVELDEPLAGIRVLELGNYIAAPTAGRLLADFGAEVIKVERPRVGDELRTWRLYAGTTSMLFRTINRNKKSIELDLRTDEGQDVIRRLIPKVDVLLENFRPGTLERWNLSPEELSLLNPNLVIVRVSAYGQTGPLSGEPGFGVIAEAVGGLRELTGDPDGPPSRMGISIGDSVAGIYAAFGAVMTLFRLARARGNSTTPTSGLSTAERTIDVALSESVLSMMESLIPDYQAYGILRTRTGGQMQGIAPSNAYECDDGRWVIIAGNGDGIYARFMEAIGREDLSARQDLSSNAARWAKREELDLAICEWTGRRNRDEVLRVLAQAGVPASPIFTAEDISKDAQFRSRGMIQHLDVSTGETILHNIGFPGIVPRVGKSSRAIRNLGPELGEHTQEVLTSLLGMSALEIAAAAGVLKGTKK